jgi:hypothetical protein
MLMKTDAKLLQEVEFFDQIDVPSLERLSYLLRHQKMWPKDFVWDFSHCQRCAMGLTIAFWNIDVHETWGRVLTSLKMNEIFHMDFESIRNIFFNFGGFYKCRISRITPKKVANKIDAYLAGL